MTLEEISKIEVGDGFYVDCDVCRRITLTTSILIYKKENFYTILKIEKRKGTYKMITSSEIGIHKTYFTIKNKPRRYLEPFHIVKKGLYEEISKTQFFEAV